MKKCINKITTKKTHGKQIPHAANVHELMIEKVSERLLAGEHHVMKNIMRGKSGSCIEQRGTLIGHLRHTDHVMAKHIHQ